MMFLVGCGCQHFASGLLQRLAEVVTSGGPGFVAVDVLATVSPSKDFIWIQYTVQCSNIYIYI